MKFYEYEYETFEGEKKTLKLRLVSGDMKLIEKLTGTSLLDYVSNPTITMLTTMLRYMSRPNIPNFSEKDSDKLYDELVDAGLTMEDIYLDVIMEALVVSGFMKKEELDEMKNKSPEEIQQEVKNKNMPRGK